MAPTTTNQTTAVTPQKQYLSIVKSEGLAKQMAASLMDNDPTKVKRIAAYMANAAIKTPALYNANKDSIIKVMLDCCSLGIEPNGRDAYVLPYRGRDGMQAQLIVSYMGMITLAMKSERIANIRAEVVHEKDFFEWEDGRIRHKIYWLKPRGEMVAVYAEASYKDGTKQNVVLTKEEVDKTRARSRAGNNGPWVTDYNEMAKKTAVRRLAKYLPLSPDAVASIQKDDEQFDFSSQQQPLPQAAPKVNADDLVDALALADTEAPAEVVEAPTSDE